MSTEKPSTPTVEDALKCIPPETVETLRLLATTEASQPFIASTFTLLPAGSRFALQDLGIMTNLCEPTSFGYAVMQQLSDNDG